MNVTVVKSFVEAFPERQQAAVSYRVQHSIERNRPEQQEIQRSQNEKIRALFDNIQRVRNEYRVGGDWDFWGIRLKRPRRGTNATLCAILGLSPLGNPPVPL